MINYGENMTSAAALDIDVTNKSNAIDNIAANFLPQQHIPPQNRQHRPAPERQVQQLQSPVVDVQSNPIHNPLRPPTQKPSQPRRSPNKL